MVIMVIIMVIRVIWWYTRALVKRTHTHTHTYTHTHRVISLRKITQPQVERAPKGLPSKSDITQTDTNTGRERERERERNTHSYRPGLLFSCFTSVLGSLFLRGLLSKTQRQV